MNPRAEEKKPGTIYTFYSYKGGVGRTMALANVSALLARWGHSVLAIDWDLEAPGLERFYTSLKPEINSLRAATPGIVDLIGATTNGQRLDWRDCLIDVAVPESSGRLSFLSAGQNGEHYTARLQSLDFSDLFELHDLGSYIEALRNDWISEFDFVLVDSRTGVTDIGGICTVHLADTLVLFFTANESSTEGVKYIVDRARKAQERLPVDRRRLLAVPVPARDESRTEYDKATEWKQRYAQMFSELYRDWLPTGTSDHEAIDQLRIPYIPYWSFGERLPVLDEGTSDRASLGHAYEVLSRILATRLDWFEALKGETLAPPPVAKRRELSSEWLERHRRAALTGLSDSVKSGFMEIVHYSPDTMISKSQPELLLAAQKAAIHTLGWPIGIVLDNREDYRPRPTAEGIVAIVDAKAPFARGRLLDYWTLTSRGDFYTLMSLQEDRNVQGSRSLIHFDTRILRTTEALLHCASLYQAMGFEPNAHIELSVRYSGLRGRSLASASPQRPLFEDWTNLYEDEIAIPPVTFTLASIDSQIVELVKKLCEPLFVIFDFASFDDRVYRDLVTSFVVGHVS